MASLDDLRDARLRLLEAEILAKHNEAEYARVKLEEASRELAMASASFMEDNILLFGNVIDENTVAQAMRTLEMYSRRTPGCDITIILDSPGGSVSAGFRLYDYIQELRLRGHYITVKVMGSAFSHGVTILQAADERIMTENAFLLIHETQIDGASGNFTQVYTEGRERVKMYQDKLLNVLASRSTKSKAYIAKKWKNSEWFMNAEEALRNGFIDSIQSPPSEINRRASDKI
jgi:ATP-dependent Clp protease protease subunit